MKFLRVPLMSVLPQNDEPSTMSRGFDEWLATQLDHLEREGLRRTRRVVTSEPDGWCVLDGRRLRNLAANDYLNLAHDPRVIAATQDALQSGVGAGASALVSGRSPWHEQLEQTIANFEGTEAALLFPTGFAANVGTLRALIAPEDTVFCDRLNHASLIDGCRQSQARMRVYRHEELDVLERELKRSIGTARRWIVTDSVFSMDGTLAPLSDLCDLAERFDASVIVDEAHGTGVFGELGRGVCELTQTEHRVAVRIGTLSKAVGTLGGFVVGSQQLVEWLWNAGRTQVFSTALPPAICAAANTAFQLIQDEPQRRQHLLAISQRLRDQLSSLGGWSVVAGSVGPIVPIVIGEPTVATAASKRMLELGLLVPAIRPPTVPRGTSRLRISLTTAFQSEEISELAAIIRSIAGAA